MPLELCLIKSVLEGLGYQWIDIRESHQAIANISRRDHVEIITQPARTSPVVGNGNHRGDPVGVGLESAKQRCHAGAAAEGDNSGSGFSLSTCRVSAYANLIVS